jgi:hypothetical protein
MSVGAAEREQDSKTVRQRTRTGRIDERKCVHAAGIGAAIGRLAGGSS